MSDKPNVTVVYTDAPASTGMGCVEMIVSVIVLAVFVVAVTGVGLWDLVWWLLLG